MEVELGKVLKPQGIKGELKVLPISLPEYLNSVRDIKIGGRPAKIVKCSLREGYAYIMIDICQDRNTAETMRELIITADKQSLQELKEGQFFYDDLIDCKVYFEDGELVGEIIDIESYGSADIFVIKQGFRQIDCPYVDGVFTEFNIELKRITACKKRFLEVTDYED